MVEGLLAVDTDERVIKVNRAAATFLDIDAEEVIGRTIQEVVRNPALQEFVAKALSAEEPVEGDIVLHNGSGDRFLQAHGTQLHKPGGGSRGAVIVLNDVTRLRRLENVRRDFVANVSHELKTPITSIKGFVETLQDGAINTPRDAEHFLEIIAKQADRMNSIVEDLLLISSVEQDVEKEKIRFDSGQVRAALREAIQVVETKGNNKDITIELECPDNLSVRMNPALLEQAVINLVDNAIKYSEPGSRVTVIAEAGGDEVVISVIDRGCGIEEKHLPRLFERFYRVDKARSRKLGGTGLGLAIVKHIVQAHRGRVTVESAPNEGSTFSIHLPKVP
jgi:two-component system phosphate regulon sensor histidine kinase PhoR